MKSFKSEQFTRKPGEVFRAADRAFHTGERIVITHSGYPDRLFELKAVELDQEENNDGSNN